MKKKTTKKATPVQDADLDRKATILARLKTGGDDFTSPLTPAEETEKLAILARHAAARAHDVDRLSSESTCRLCDCVTRLGLLALTLPSAYVDSDHELDLTQQEKLREMLEEIAADLETVRASVEA